MIKKTLCLFAIAVSASCGEPQSGTLFPDTVVDDSFGSGSLRRDDGVSMTYRVGILEDEGTFVVCAAAQNVRTTQERRVLAALKVTVNDQVLQRGLGWARAYPGSGSLNGQLAACRKTTVAFVENAEFDIELTQTSFSRQRD